VIPQFKDKVFYNLAPKFEYLYWKKKYCSIQKWAIGWQHELDLWWPL